MDFWFVRDGELERWRRMGECKRCGKCCCGTKITYSMQTQLMGDAVEPEEGEGDSGWEDWDSYAIFAMQGIWWRFKITKVDASAECHCGSLDDEGLCKEWQDPVNFKPICRYWPWDPYQASHWPDCGFQFERVDE